MPSTKATTRASIGLAVARFPGGSQSVQQARGRCLGHSPVPNHDLEGAELGVEEEAPTVG
jgi:hypothetical protein